MSACLRPLPRGPVRPVRPVDRATAGGLAQPATAATAAATTTTTTTTTATATASATVTATATAKVATAAARALTLALAPLLLTGPAAALTPAEVFAQVSGSVWRVQTLDNDGLLLGQGSAVVVAPGKLVTNCHVLARARRVLVRRDGQAAGVSARLELWDVMRDLCQLDVPSVNARPVGLAVAAQAQVGQPAYAIGHPKGLDLTMSAGLVSSFRRNTAGQLVLIQTSAAISGGSSGGGLFNDQGQLLGLTTLEMTAAQNLNFAIPADWIRDLPRRHAAARAAERAASAGAPSTGGGTAPANPEPGR